MPFERYVETGRVALVSDGPHKGKLVTIVDVIDQTRVLVDGPETKVPRGELRLNQLQLTKFRLRYPFTASTRIVRKAWKDAKVDDKWKNSLWSKHLEDKAKSTSMSDFDRFKLRRARQIRNRLRTRAYTILKKVAIHKGTFYGKPKSLKQLKPERKPKPEGKRRPGKDERAGKPPRTKKTVKRPKPAVPVQPAGDKPAKPAKRDKKGKMTKAGKAASSAKPGKTASPAKAAKTASPAKATKTATPAKK